MKSHIHKVRINGSINWCCQLVHADRGVQGVKTGLISITKTWVNTGAECAVKIVISVLTGPEDWIQINNPLTFVPKLDIWVGNIDHLNSTDRCFRVVPENTVKKSRFRQSNRSDGTSSTSFITLKGGIGDIQSWIISSDRSTGTIGWKCIPIKKTVPCKKIRTWQIDSSTTGTDIIIENAACNQQIHKFAIDSSAISISGVIVNWRIVDFTRTAVKVDSGFPTLGNLWWINPEDWVDTFQSPFFHRCHFTVWYCQW